MDRTIRIDDEVYIALQKGAEPFTDTPNSALRRILGLDEKQRERSDTVPNIYLIPSSPKEFDIEELKDFLRNMHDAKASYLAASDRFWKNVQADSICLFHKDKCIVGEGKMNGKTKYAGTEKSPVTKRPYALEIDFIPETIKLYKRPVRFAEVEAALGLGKPLGWRVIQSLNMAGYSTVTSIAKKDGYE